MEWDWLEFFFYLFIVWWVSIFLVLPLWVKIPDKEEKEEGHAASAPEHPHLVRKLLLNTVIALLITASFMWAKNAGFLSIY